VDQLDSESTWPRLLRVAGFYPGVTASELAATPGPGPAAQKGKWNFEFPDEHGAEFGVTCVPGSDILQFAKDPVVVVATAASLGLLLQEDTEVLCILDRADTDFSERHFFAFQDPNNNIVIRRFDAPMPPGYAIQARVIFVNLPYDPKTQAPSGTWLEEGDVSM